LHHDDFSVLHREPAPARAKLRRASLDEIFLRLRNRAQIRDDFLLERARNFVAAAVRLHPLPEMQMIVVLSGIIEEAGIFAEGILDDLFERLAFQPAALK